MHQSHHKTEGASAEKCRVRELDDASYPRDHIHFSDGPTRHHRSWPTPRPRWAVCALLKTRPLVIQEPVPEQNDKVWARLLIFHSEPHLSAFSMPSPLWHQIRAKRA
jgi:hypothetical protein